MVRMQIMGDGSEIIQYDKAELPLYVRHGLLSYYPDMRAECHWHEDIELIYILSGKMNYYISGEKILLKKGDFLFVNTGELHYGYDSDKEECSFICILFSPTILQACGQLYTESIEPLLKDNDFLFLNLHENKIITSEIKKIISAKRRTGKKGSVYELEAVGALYKIWSEIYKIYSTESLSRPVRKSAKTKNRDSVLLKKMVAFIRSHYRESISLSQIAATCNISKSKCCELFSRETHTSPLCFLNEFRLRTAANILRTSNLKITQIAFDTGFNGASYFSEQFKRYYKISPAVWRRQNQSL